VQLHTHTHTHTYIYILLIIEHNGDASLKKKIVYPENNRSAIVTLYVLCAVRSEFLKVVQLERALTSVNMIQCFRC